MNLKWRLAQARGYLGLGMVREAAAELKQVPEEEAERPEVLALTALVLQEREDWPKLVGVARRLVRYRPREAGWWIAWAYATRRSRSLAAAEAILLKAEHVHPHEPTVQFNLGCYACLRGDLDEARRSRRCLGRFLSSRRGDRSGSRPAPQGGRGLQRQPARSRLTGPPGVWHDSGGPPGPHPTLGSCFNAWAIFSSGCS